MKMSRRGSGRLSRRLPLVGMAIYAVSFAKTGAALLSVTIANVWGVDRTSDRDGWQAWRAFGGTSAAF